MLIIENLLPVLIAFFVVTVSPGPANIAVATVALTSGRRAGIRFGAGLAAGLAFWGLIAGTGLGVVLQASEYALFVLKLLGGAYLCWLAFQSARSAAQPDDAKPATTVTRNWFWRGLLLNLLNPKAVVAWMAALSMGLSANSTGNTLVITVALCMVLGLINYTGHAIIFSSERAVAAYNKFRRFVDGLVAGLFAFAGLGLIRSAFAR